MQKRVNLNETITRKRGKGKEREEGMRKGDFCDGYLNGHLFNMFDSSVL